MAFDQPELEKGDGPMIHPVVSYSVGEVNTVSAEELDNTVHRGLKSRHAQMIALGGSIGTGLFVSSGQGLHQGGPLFLLLAYIIISILVYGVITATTEISSYMPVPGGTMAYYGHRYVSKSLAFALGWLYTYTFAIDVPNEITAAGLVIKYWNPPVHIAVWITLLTVVVIALNCFPVKVYGETEFWFAGVKVLTILGLLILSVVLILGGGPSHQRLGFHNWIHPGPTKELYVSGPSGRLCALLSTTIFSVFSFAFAPELLVATGGEMESPRRNLAKAGKRFFYRLLVFYVLGVFAIGFITNSNNSQLLGGGDGAGSSPWVIAMKEAGIHGLDSVVNAAILISAWSCSNSFLYLSSRSLYSMALVGNAPKIFSKCTASGVPLYAIAASSSLSALAYLNCSSSGTQVFNWFVNIINTGGFISWMSCCIIYLRFRKAATIQGIVDVPYRSRLQPYMAWISLCAFTILLLLNGYEVFLNGNWNTSTFLTSYIGIPVFMAFFLGYKFITGEKVWMYGAQEIDLTTGLAEVIAAETPPRKDLKWYDWWRYVVE